MLFLTHIKQVVCVCWLICIRSRASNGEYCSAFTDKLRQAAIVSNQGFNEEVWFYHVGLPFPFQPYYAKNLRQVEVVQVVSTHLGTYQRAYTIPLPV